MKRSPYSIHEAENIAIDFGHLAGHPFANEGNYIIESIAVSPFDELNQARFLQLYLLMEDKTRALTSDYRGLLFDVLIIARAEYDEMDIKWECLCDWLTTNRFFPAQNKEACTPVFADSGR